MISNIRRRRLGPLAMALCALLIVLALARTGMMIRMRVDASFPEGAVVARAWDVAQGGSAYTDWRLWPHHFAPYGPLTYYPAGWLARFIRVAGGADLADTPRILYDIGRVQSIAALVGIGVLMVFMLRAVRVRAAWAIGAAALVSLWTPLVEFVMSYRPDAPQVFFSMLALTIAMRGPPTSRRILGTLAALQASMWFKPTAWGMIAALALWIATDDDRSRGRKRAALWIGGFGLTGLIAALAFNFATEGRLFLNMLGSLDNGWDFTNLSAFYTRAAGLPGLTLLGGVLLAVVVRGRLKSDSDDAGALRLLCLALMLAFLTTSAQNFKVGADINYYLETYALSGVVLAWGLSRLWDGDALSTRGRGLREAAFIVILLPALLWIAVRETRYAVEDLPGFVRSWGSTTLEARVESIPGPLFGTNPYFLMTRPEFPAVLDQIQFRILFERGHLADDALIDRIESRAFVAVIVSRADVDPEDPGKLPDLFSPRFGPALMSNYKVSDTIGVAHVVLVPRR